MPVALNGERVGAEAEAALMLPRIDFDLQLEWLPASCFGGELEHEMSRVLGLRSAAFAQPRQHVPDSVDDVADGLCPRLHQIDVLGVSQRPLEEQFVDSRAAAEGDSVAKGRAREQVAQCAREIIRSCSTCRRVERSPRQGQPPLQGHRGCGAERNGSTASVSAVSSASSRELTKSFSRPDSSSRSRPDETRACR